MQIPYKLKNTSTLKLDEQCRLKRDCRTLKAQLQYHVIMQVTQ